jgi:hypothetical protein
MKVEKMEYTTNNEMSFDVKNHISSLLLSSRDFLADLGYEINLKYIDEISDRLFSAFAWLYNRCGIRKFQIKLIVYLENNKVFEISNWSEVKNGEVIRTWGEFKNIETLRFSDTYKKGQGAIYIHTLSSEEFSDYWHSLTEAVERSKVLSEIEKFIRNSFLISYINVNPGGVEFGVPVMFDIFEYLI